MTISRQAYREIEDVLGPENISDDIAIRDAYASGNPLAYPIYNDNR